MQNTKLQKYTRGAGNDRTRAVRLSHRVSFTIWTVYGQGAIARRGAGEKERKGSVCTWHGTAIELGEPRLC